MEHYQKFVSSRGILRSCDLFNPNPQSSSRDIEYGAAAQFPAGGSIYCCTDALENFASHVLDGISEPFVLVSGDADTVVSPQTLETGVFDKILSHPTLLRWYAQNIGASGEELYFLPIGLDYHTMSHSPRVWGDTVNRSAFEQERMLLDLRSRAAPAPERTCLAYCNWQFSLQYRGRDGATITNQERVQCLEVIDRTACFLEPAFVPRTATWAKQTEHAFVLCPAGNGPDTHRLWEALVLGCIPIVKRNFMSQFLSDLPVVVVDDWREVGAAFLRKCLADMAARRFNFAKLYLEYWCRAIRGAAQDSLPMATLPEFQAAY
jgi:hypothetical protein